MNYSELTQHAEMCQMAADEMAYQLTDLIERDKILSIFQSQCNFNLFWLYSIAPEVVLHIKTIEFLNNNSDNFKRKLSIKELLNYDLVINLKEPYNFNDFKKQVVKLK